jgi:hypothetical protein
MPFHTDPADLVTMLCIRSAAAGGLSRLASARAVHDLLLAEAPHLLAELYRPLPQNCARRFVEESQRHADAPRLTAGQLAALDVFDAIVARPGVALELDMRPGDLHLFNDLETVHSRTEFTGGRLLLRLCLSHAGSPQPPDSFRDLFCATAAGSYRGGAWPPDGRPDRIGLPVRSEPTVVP